MYFESPNLRVEMDPRGFATLWLDVQGQRFNVLNRAVLHELFEAMEALRAPFFPDEQGSPHLARWRQEPKAKFVVIRSAKESGFCAGADLNAFAKVKSAEEAAQLSELGKSIFHSALTDRPFSTIALIDGPCLGGGLELALHCEQRWAIDQPGTQLGLPEVELGLIPGWGGTFVLPRVVGVENALKLILTGRRLGAAESLRWGLVDRLVAPTAIGQALDEFVSSQGYLRPPRRRRRTWRQWLLEANPLGRAFLFRSARRQLDRKVPDDMPAPHEALRAVEHAFLRIPEDYEKAAIARLSQTPACRNLINLFFLREKTRGSVKAWERESAREGESALPRSHPPTLPRKIGVVGAGTMGAGIAQLAAIKGFDVVVQEVNEQALAAGIKRIEDLFNQAVERKILSAEEAHAKLDRLGRTTTWQGFDNVDLVVEAVIEDVGPKRQVFQELERRAAPGTILATNTSSLLVRQIQEGLAHPERVAGLHFFNPVHKMPLIEVAHAPRTDHRTVAALVQWAVALGKTPVVVKDSPGFVVNRILMPYLNEAVTLAAEGMPIERVDQVMRRFGMPVGPLELLDQVGLDVAAHIAQATRPAFGTRLVANDLFEKMARSGWLGQKNGVGFYRYDGKKKHPNAGVVGLVNARRDIQMSEEEFRQARERMVLLMVNEAAACLAEELAESAETIDLAMVLGTGWAPHRGGPLRYADDVGPLHVLRSLDHLRRERGPRFEACEELRRRALEGERFHENGGTMNDPRGSRRAAGFIPAVWERPGVPPG